MGDLGLRVEDGGCGVWNLGFRTSDFRIQGRRVEDLGFGVGIYGLGSKLGLKLGVSGSGNLKARRGQDNRILSPIPVTTKRIVWPNPKYSTSRCLDTYGHLIEHAIQKP